MQVQVDIGFEQLLQIVKNLSATQLSRLKAEIEKDVNADKSKIDLETLLLNGPTATKKNWKPSQKIEKLSTNGGQNRNG